MKEKLFDPFDIKDALDSAEYSDSLIILLNEDIGFSNGI